MILCWVFAALACETYEQISQWPDHANYLPLTYAAMNHFTPHKKKLGRGRKHFFWKRSIVSRKEIHFIKSLRSHFLTGYSVSLWPWHPLFRADWYRSGIWWTLEKKTGSERVGIAQAPWVC